MPESESYDAVIVGAGAGGSAVAWALTRHGMRVLVLESGPRFDPFKDYALDVPDWELRHFPRTRGSQGRYSYGAMQRLEASFDDLRSWNHLRGRYVRGSRREVAGYQHVRGVGGSTLRYSGEAHRLHPQAMKMRSRFGVAADWPLSYAELEPYYAEVEKQQGVAGPADDRHRPRSKLLQPPHPLSYASTRIRAGGRRLGMEWQPNTLAILSRPMDGRPSCNYCGNCARGCPRTDKGSADVTFMRKAEASGHCTVRANATVLELHSGPRDRIASVTYSTENGEPARVSAQMLVLAGGAVETPRLLLNCTTGDNGGLANESGLVGRNFMETLFWSSHGLFEEPLGSHRGVPVDAICWDFNGPDSIRGVAGGVRLSITTMESALNGPVAYATRVVGGWGSGHKRDMRETFGRVIGVGGIGESLPNPGSYVDLDPEVVDEHGQPVARIHSYLPDSELRRLRFLADSSRDILQASGAQRIIEEFGSYDQFNSTHVFGTCRMGTSPQDSVVDGYGRSHRWRNLYITDASVFPSSGGGESPALTIQALAIRAGEHMRETLMRRDVPVT